jgi:hypothetical protein
MNLIQWTSLIVSILTVFMLLYLYKHQKNHRPIIISTFAVAVHAVMFYLVVAFDGESGVGKYTTWSSVLRFQVYFTFFVTTTYRVIRIYKKTRAERKPHG